METIDWRMISFGFSFIQFVFTAIIFCVIKFNDLKHLDQDFKDLKNDIKKYETQNDTRHLENLKAINEIAVQLSGLAGRCNAVQEIKTELNK